MEKCVAGVIDPSGKLPLVSLMENLPLVSTTPAVLAANLQPVSMIPMANLPPV
jgi:hypothetical protein